MYGEGFVLRRPARGRPDELGPFQPSAKVAAALYDANLRTEQMGISTMGDFNALVAQGKATEVILAQEAIMEKRIGDIAEEIAGRKEVRFVWWRAPPPRQDHLFPPSGHPAERLPA
jgi:uridine kinase